MVSADVDVIALRLRKEGLLAQMPLADERRLVARRLEHLAERDFLERKLIDVFSSRTDDFLSCRSPFRKFVRFNRAGIATRLQAGSRGRADRVRSVVLREPHAGLGEPIDVRRLIETAPVATEIPLTEIVDDDEDDVGLINGLSR